MSRKATSRMLRRARPLLSSVARHTYCSKRFLVVTLLILVASEVRYRRPGRTDGRKWRRSEGIERLRSVNNLAGHGRKQRFDILDVVFWNAEVIGVEDGEIGVLPGCDAALNRFLLAEPGASDSP